MILKQESLGKVKEVRETLAKLLNQDQWPLTSACLNLFMEVTVNQVISS